MAEDIPTDAYLDTSVSVGMCIDGIPHSAASRDYCEHLILARSRIYYSQILWLEYAEALRRLSRRAQVPEHLRQQFQLDLWDTNLLIRQRWMSFGIHRFQLFINRFDRVYELPFQRCTWDRSIDFIALDQLHLNDAVHVATARQHGLRDFVTLDDHFLRISDLRVVLLRDS